MSAVVSGFCHERFTGVRNALAASLASGADLGASVAITLDGEFVVDLWGGHLDQERTQPWREETIVNVYSTTKTMSFLCALVLADRGLLDFDAPVHRYWPEFAAEGKEKVLVWHLMDHAAGLSGMDEPVSQEDLYDWQRMTSLLAAQKPWWEPGTATAYHALTQGYLIGEVVRRVSGLSIGRFFREEIASPLGADFHIGVPVAEFPRIGHLTPPRGDAALAPGSDPDSIAARTFRNPAVKASWSHTAAWKQAEIPAANGHGNARSVARIHALLACQGEAFGKRLLRDETARAVMQERISGVDLALNAPLRFGLGFGINSSVLPLAPNPNVCFWGGWGGSVALIDQDARMSIAYVMNRMHDGLMGDTRSGSLIQAAYAALQP